MKEYEILKEIYHDIDYDINGVWDDSIEDDYDFVGKIESVLSYINNKYVKDEIIEIIKHYVYRYYEELQFRKDDKNE